MTKREKNIIVKHYEKYLRNADNCNPIGGFTDIEEMFIELERESSELHEEMQRIFYETSLTSLNNRLNLN